EGLDAFFGNGDALHSLLREPWPPGPLLILNPQMELTQLLRVDRRRRSGHQIERVRRLRERDDLPDGRLAGQDRHQAVEAERDAAMRRRPVLERVEEEAEPQPGVVLADPE